MNIEFPFHKGNWQRCTKHVIFLFPFQIELKICERTYTTRLWWNASSTSTLRKWSANECRTGNRSCINYFRCSMNHWEFYSAKVNFGFSMLQKDQNGQRSESSRLWWERAKFQQEYYCELLFVSLHQQMEFDRSICRCRYHCMKSVDGLGWK